MLTEYKKSLHEDGIEAFLNEHKVIDSHFCENEALKGNADIVQLFIEK